MKDKIIVLASVIVAIIPFLVNFGPLARTQTLPDLIKELEMETVRLLDTYTVPGVAISILDGGEVRWMGTFGHADLEQGVRMDEGTVFQVASISKSVAAVGAMKLVEEGTISLADPAQTHLTRWRFVDSDFPTEGVILQRLLSHTAGLTVPGYPGYPPDDPLPSLTQSLDGQDVPTARVKLFQQPGTAFRYSGGGYTILQLIIEEVTGGSYADYMDSEVLAPLEMTSSSFEWQEPLRAGTAKAYDANLTLLPNYLFAEQAAAGLYTTIGDLSRFVIAEYDSYRGHPQGLLSQPTMETIYQPVAEVQGLEGFIYEYMGLGHFINFTPDGTKLVLHDGGNDGWRSNFTLVPETGAGIVILTNGNNGQYVINDVLDAWHRTLFRAPRFRTLDRISNSVYSLAAVLLLWSVIALLNLIAELRQGIRGFTLTGGRIPLILRGAIAVILVALVWATAAIIAPLLRFISPTIGAVLLTAVAVRSMLGVVQLVVPGRKADSHPRTIR